MDTTTQPPATDPNATSGMTDTTASNPLLVTSSASRTAYTDNVNKMNSAVANTTGLTTYNYVDASGKVASVPASSPDEAMSKATNADPKSGVAPAPVGETPAAPPAATTTTASTSKAAPQDVDNGDGTTTMADGTRIATGLKSTYVDTNTQLDQGIADAKSTLSAAAATLQNDPAAQAAIAMVMAKYGEQIAAMKEKNRILAGSDITNAARSGSLQYAPEMTGNFLSEEQDKASKRVADLITLETQMVLKTQQAFKDGDVKAFTAASDALEKAQKGKTDAISKLLSETDKVIKQNQTEAKLQSQKVKDQLTTDIKTSTGIAKTIAETIASSGVTDEKKKSAYIAAVAKENGISNATILESAVAKATQDNTKFEISTAKGRKALAGKGGGSPTATKNQVIANITARFGDQNKNESGYSVRGQDNYVDPEEYIGAYKQWITKYPDKDFLAKFPVKQLVNPASYSKLPKALQPAAKKSSAGGATPP